MPYIDNVTASSEHAFAGRDARRPFKPPLGVLHAQQYTTTAIPPPQRSPSLYDVDARPPSSPLLPPPPSPHSPRASQSKSLRSSKSLGDGLRSSRGYKQRESSATDSSLPTPPVPRSDGVRESYRSALTSHSSFALTSSINTERSSFTGLTACSSHSDLGALQKEDWQESPEADMSVDDVLGMYEGGFDSAVRPSFDVQSVRSMDRPKHSLEVRSLHGGDRPISQPHADELKKRPHYAHRRSKSASMLLGIAKGNRPGASSEPNLAPPEQSRGPSLASSRAHSGNPSPSRPVSAAANAPIPRDRYGFKKASHYITVEQYDAWDAGYREHLERRSKKWHALMRSYGLATDQPFRFPPKSDKMKRYVRKGIPPEFRGAAWFWYAGGPGKLAKERGLYRELVEKAEQHGFLGDVDREHIERDLNRTFPDNVRFKPDPTTTLDAQADAGGGGAGKDSARASQDPTAAKPPETESSVSEPPILRALRRVLQAFAIHNPSIGYCQSLNFLAGLLLLFLDEDEEKAFVLLNIITTTHLPGTHGVALEGANIDIAVLMSCVKDSLPAIWAKLDDQPNGGAPSGPGPLRLPTVSLATTAWFMCLFVGNLPIEVVLRVWDCLFFEGSKTLFRMALAIFKAGEPAILGISDPMEIFQLVQTLPRRMLDANALLEVCFRRRGGFGGLSQGLIESRRHELRVSVKEGVRAAAEREDEEVEGRLRRFTRRVRSRTAK